MGDQNQMMYLKRHVPVIDGPVLEIGSKEYGSTSSFRDYYEGNEYVGVDMLEGEGVDVVVDLARTVGPLPERHFELGICCSVLEHVDKPWVFAENLTRLIRPGGFLYVSVPWVWRYHPYPDDYFRFSHRGVISLFGGFEWSDLAYSTTAPGEFFELDEANPAMDNELSLIIDTPDDTTRKYLPYLMINMIGTRRPL